MPARPALMHVMPSLHKSTGSGATFALLKGLQAEGWHVSVACADCGVERELSGLGIQLHVTPVRSGNPLMIWLNSRRLSKIVAENQVRLVHAHDIASGWSGALAARRAGAVFLTSLHHELPVNPGAWKRRYASVMTAGDRIVVGSDYLADMLQETQQVEPARLRMIRPGVDLQSFDPDTVRGHRMAALSERWQLSLDHKIVLLPGRICPENGQLDVIKMMAQGGRTDWQLLLTGELDKSSAYVRSLEQAILSGRLSDRVVFGGACEDMAAAFMMADLVALPALRESESMAFAIQAQAMGKPVLVTQAGALPEAVLPASTGWLVQPGDLQEMRSAFELALDMDREVRARLSKRAREFAAEEFSMAQMIRKTAALYRELVPQAPRPVMPRPSIQGGGHNILSA